MKPLQKRNSLLLVLAAFIWGIAFVAQSEGGKSIGPYTFNGIRFLLGAAVLCPVIFLMNKKMQQVQMRQNRQTATPC